MKEDPRVDEYIKLRRGFRELDQEDVSRLVNLAFTLTHEFMHYNTVFHGFTQAVCDDCNFNFKRTDGSVFSIEDCMVGNAEIDDANLINTEEWYRKIQN